MTPKEAGIEPYTEKELKLIEEFEKKNKPSVKMKPINNEQGEPSRYRFKG